MYLKYSLKFKRSFNVQKGRFSYLEDSLIWNISLSDNAEWIMHSCTFSLDSSHILSFPNSLPIWLHRWKCLEQNWIYCVWFWMLNEKRKDINLEETIHCLFPSSPTPHFLLLVIIFAQVLRMMESQPIESKPASDLCGNVLPCCSFLSLEWRKTCWDLKCMWFTCSPPQLWQTNKYQPNFVFFGSKSDCCSAAIKLCL